MRILFISHYFPPEVNAPASRTHEHCRQWVSAGHDVTVVTGVPNHPYGKLFPGFKNRWIQEEMVDGIRVLRTWMLLTANSGFLKRILNFVLFGLTAAWASRRIKAPDVVIATSPQFFCGLSGALVARLKRRPFILEIRDLWPKSIVELDQLKEGPALRTLEVLERWMYREADGIVVNTQAFIEHITSAGVPRERIELVYNGIDANRFQPRPRDEELEKEFDLEGRTTVAYIGTLGLAHGLAAVIETADALRGEKEILFLLIGGGAEGDRLEKLIAERQLSNIRLIGLQPRDRMPAWIATVDILLVCLRDLPVFETVIPSKIFEFLAQQRPVIVTARGEIARMAQEADVALVTEPENPQALADAIQHVRAHPIEAQRRAAAGAQWVQEQFQREHLAQKMLQFVEKTLEMRS
ncbi:MAG: glycosyltransferase family 4 protein [Myxococcota bacterium]|nr:glycosyltransferase family 4 protein [Myxococcota bacterium]